MEGVPDLRRVRILDGVMRAKSGSFTTITYEGYYKLLQDASFHHDKTHLQGSRRHQIKAHEVFTECSQEIHDNHPSPQDDPQPTAKEDTVVVQLQTQGEPIPGAYPRNTLEEILL